MNPSLAILEQALVFSVRQRSLLFKAVGLPAILVGGLALVPAAEGIFALPSIIVGLCANAWLALATHRVALLGDTESFRWGRREWRFVGTFLLIGAGLVGLIVLLSLPVMGLAMLLPPLTGFFNLVLVGVVVFSAYQIAQVSIILPAAALEQSLGIRQAHALMAGRRGTAFATVMLIPLLIYLPVSAMAFAQLPVLRTLLPAVLDPLAAMLAVLMLSFLYRFIIEEVANRPEPPGADTDAAPPPQAGP